MTQKVQTSSDDMTDTDPSTTFTSWMICLLVFMFIILYNRKKKNADTDTSTAASVRAVENLLKYRFKNKKLLEEALTRSSSTSYQRLEFIGDAALSLAVSKYFFLAFPNLGRGELTRLRVCNISNENLARVAVRHGLDRYVHLNDDAQRNEVKAFAIAVEQEDETQVHGRTVKAPKVLADIVESVAAAVFVDCRFDLKALWVIFSALLEPLQDHHHPVTLLKERCEKAGKRVKIRRWGPVDEKCIAIVYVDGQVVASATSGRGQNAMLHAAKAALPKLLDNTGEKTGTNIVGDANGSTEIEGAARKLQELCQKKRWQKPDYRTEEEIGIGTDDKRFICSVEIEAPEDVFFIAGDEKSGVKDARNSAASLMLLGLQGSESFMI